MAQREQRELEAAKPPSITDAIKQIRELLAASEEAVAEEEEGGSGLVGVDSQTVAALTTVLSAADAYVRRAMVRA